MESKLSALADKAVKAGASAEDALKFKTDVQVAAFESGKVSAEDALKIENWHQIDAIQIRYSVESEYPMEIKGTFRTRIYTVQVCKRGVPIEYVLKVKNAAQVAAINKHVFLEEALKFENENQVRALQKGIPIEDVLKFEYSSQIDALQLINKMPGSLVWYALTRKMPGSFVSYALTLSEEDKYSTLDYYIHYFPYFTSLFNKTALKLENDYQFLALQEGVSVEDALKFENSYQVAALERGVSVEDALKFENSYQVAWLQVGVPAEDALKFEDRSIDQEVSEIEIAGHQTESEDT